MVVLVFLVQSGVRESYAVSYVSQFVQIVLKQLSLHLYTTLFILVGMLTILW